MGVTVHKPAITSENIGKLYNCLDLNTPTGLQNKIFLDFMLYFCNRGRENLRELKRDDFKFEGTGENRYVELRDNLTKYHRADHEECQGGRLYAVQNHRMYPVQSLEKYMLLLNQDYEVFFQQIYFQ